MKRPPAAASAFSKEHREAALRERGLLPPLPVKDLSQLEREQDSFIPVVSLPPLDEAPKDAEGGASAADLIKKQWEAKNVDEDTMQRQRLQTFKFGGGSTTDLTASTTTATTSVGGVQSPADTSDLEVSALQGLDLPNADKSASSSPQCDLRQQDTNLLASTSGDSQKRELPMLPDVLVSGSTDFTGLFSSKPSSTSPVVAPAQPTPLKDDTNASQLASVTRNKSTKTTISTNSSSIPPSLDNTSSRTLSSSSEELSLAYNRASSELKDAATTSSSPSIGGAGKLKGQPPILRVVPGGGDIPVIVENGDEDHTYSEEPLGLGVADEATVRGDSPRTLLPSQVLAAEANSESQTAARASTETDESNYDDARPPIPPRDREPVRASNESSQPTPQLHFESQPKSLPSTRKRGMTLDPSTASRTSSESSNAHAVPAGNAPVRRKTLNPFKRRGQKDRSVSPAARRDTGSSPPTSTLGKIGRSVVGSVLRPSRQQTAPASPRSPYLHAHHHADDVPSLDQNLPPGSHALSVPSSPRMGAAHSQSPPASPSRRNGPGYGIFQRQQQQQPAEEDAIVRQAVSPTYYSHGDIHAEASAIKDDEQRRVTEMAFLY